MKQNESNNTLFVTPQNPESRWVALDVHDKIISEGETPDEVQKKAMEIAEKFFLLYIPIKDNNYVF